MAASAQYPAADRIDTTPQPGPPPRLGNGVAHPTPRNSRKLAMTPEGRHIMAVFTRRQFSGEKEICHMTKPVITSMPDPSGFSPDPSTEILRSGARRLIEQAVEAELAALLAARPDERTADGRSRLVRHTGNVLNEMPKPEQSRSKGHLHDIWQAETRAEAEAAFDFFVETCGVKYDKAAAKLVKDRDVLLAFYDFPAEH